MNEFFIMTNAPSGKGVMPIIDEDENVTMFDTLGEAIELADNHDACPAFGYEIFQRGQGEG